MAVSDTMILIGIMFLFNTLIMYKKNKFFGGIIYILISVAIMQYINTNAGNAIGLVMLLSSIGIMYYDMTNKFNPTKMRG